MTKVNMQNLFTFLILVSLQRNIRGDFGNITEQKKIASATRHENNFAKILGETVITTAITVDDEKFDDNELGKLFVKNFKLYEKLEKDRNKNETREMRQRTSRDTVNGSRNLGMECLACYAEGITSPDENCYEGYGVPSEKCADAEQCYTELHPLYIKRGCILPGSLNRTFVCKCPLCNDKPSYDSTYYEYTKLSDWEYDNERLQKPVMGIDLICKVCETRGVNKVTDNICKLGQNADYMVCAHNQYCFININDQSDYVSRGCITPPAFNSMYFFCNKLKCNNVAYPNLKVKQAEEILFRATTEASALVSKNPSLKHGLAIILTLPVVICAH